MEACLASSARVRTAGLRGMEVHLTGVPVELYGLEVSLGGREGGGGSWAGSPPCHRTDPGLPAGLLESQLPEEEAKCCEVQWDSCDHPPDSSSDTSPKSTASESLHYHRHDPHLHHQRQNHYHLYHHHQYHHSPSLLPVSAGSRLGSSRIRLCVLVLMLLHTMVSFSSVHGGGGGLGPETLPSLDESVARDE